MDNLDLTVFDAHFLTAVTAAAAAVPEPGAIVLALTALLGLTQFIRRRDGHPH